MPAGAAIPLRCSRSTSASRRAAPEPSAAGRHGAKLEAVQTDGRTHAEMIAAEHFQAPVELILGNAERNIADCPMGAAEIFSVAPFDRQQGRQIRLVREPF